MTVLPERLSSASDVLIKKSSETGRASEAVPRDQPIRWMHKINPQTIDNRFGWMINAGISLLSGKAVAKASDRGFSSSPKLSSCGGAFPPVINLE